MFRVHKSECKKNVKHFKTKNSLKYKKNNDNNGCFDFCDKYTLPMYLESAYNWYLLILENRLYKIFLQICKSNHSIVL